MTARLRRWCIALCFAMSTAGVAAATEYDLNVRIDPATRAFNARGVLTLGGSGERTLGLASRFEVTRLAMNGNSLGLGVVEEGRRVWRIAPSNRAQRRIDIEWRGTLEPLDAGLDHRQTLQAVLPVSGEAGTFLPDSSFWYPRIAGEMERYRVSLELPAGQRGLVAGRLVEEFENARLYRARFEFSHPAEGIDLMAGPYRVTEKTMIGAGGKAIRLRTYFHPQVAQFADAYLESVKGYVELYEPWIGGYPFTEFSVVSSPTPTGFGMPTLTYLGIDVIRLPFIRATSLGHEVLHNWWGNGVYPDYARGNWSEGLTTFMADYAYKERESAEAAREMRLAWLRDFAALAPGQDAPLAGFTSRTHGASQIVGYNKAAMLFFMLRDQIGAAAFDEGLRTFWREQQFRVAGWPALRRAFESAAKTDLGGFFEQWLTRAGAPQLQLVEAARSGEASKIAVTLAQIAPPYRVRVPLLVRTAAGEEMHRVELESEKQQFTIALKAEAREVAIDPELRLFRRLRPDEAPPILREVMVDPDTVTVVLSDRGAERDAAEALAAKLQDHSPRFVAAVRPPQTAPLLVIGLQREMDAWLAKHRLPVRPSQVGNAGTAQVWTARSDSGHTIAVISAADAPALQALVRPLPHYGRQSYIVFNGSKATSRGTWPAKTQTITVN